MSQIKALSESGGRGRAACARVAEIASDLAVALRRAVPFLARRRVSVTTEAPTTISFADLAMDMTVVHASAFALLPGSARGLILMDDVALARILNGVLGGDGNATPQSATLTSAQGALATRVSSGMLRAFGEVLSAKLGFGVETASGKDMEGSAVIVPLIIEGGGRVTIALPLAAIKVEEKSGDDHAIDSDIAAAMIDVELDVVAELGKVRLPLEVLAGLKVGDVLRLTLPIDQHARVCAGGAVLFHGRPTASGEVVAIAIDRQA